MKRGCITRAGFTLLELLVSLSIFSIISLAVYSSFAGGIGAWRTAQEFSTTFQTARLLLDDMARELKNAVSISETEFVGERKKLSFLTVRQSPYSTNQPANHKITRVTYELRRDQNSSGDALFRLEASDIDESQGSQEETELMVGSISEFALQYTYKDGKGEVLPWKDSWGLSDEIPLGVKMTLKIGETRFTKTVFIPHGYQEEEEKSEG
jgi:type II secretion system protein J